MGPPKEKIPRQDPPIVKATIEMIEYFAPVYKQMPNWAKRGTIVPALCRSMESLLFELASAAKVCDKLTHLERADADLDCVRFYMRICYKNRLVTPKQDEVMARHIVNVGNQLGGWLYSIEGRPQGKK